MKNQKSLDKIKKLSLTFIEAMQEAAKGKTIRSLPPHHEYKVVSGSLAYAHKKSSDNYPLDLHAEELEGRWEVVEE